MAKVAGTKLELKEGSYPLSPMQQGMLFHSLRARESGVDVSQVIADCPEELDGAALKNAWQQLAARHDVLRTAFRWEGLDEPRQEPQPQAAIPFTEHDWQGVPAGEQAARLQALLREERSQGFELTISPLMRVSLVRKGQANFTMVWTYHHILLDGRSLGLLMNELFVLYEAVRQGQAPALPQARPFRDYVEWLHEQDWSKAEGFWRQKLKGFSAATPLIARSDASEAADRGDSPGIPLPMENGGAFQHTRGQQISVPEAVTSAARAMAREHALTLNTLIQGTWALLLSRYSSEEDVVFGAVRAGRRGTVEAAVNIAGLFINTLPVRVHVAPEMEVLPWLKEIRSQWIELRNFEHTPLVKIQGWSEAASGSPLFESILNVQDPSWDAELTAQEGKWRSRRFCTLSQPGYPLALDVYGGAELVVKVLYDPKRLDDATIARLLGHFRRVFEAMVENPHRKVKSLPLLTDAEARQLEEWNRTKADFPKVCVHKLFEEQADRIPEALAVSGPESHLTYGELERRANQLAHQLREMGVGPDVLVGIWTERSLEMVVGQLAILKAGGAYMPIDAACPAERVTFMLEDAGISVLLAQSRFRERLPDGARTARMTIWLDDALREAIDPQRSSRPDSGATPKNLAYVIYTSGSTGRPKGVEIEHAGLVNVVTWHQRFHNLTPADRGCLLANPAFDASVWELWSCLTVGASVHIPKPEIRLSPKALLEWLAANKITACFLPTPLAEAVMDEPWPENIALAALLTGGDRLHRRPRHPLRCMLINHYGPTETTVLATAGVVAPGGGTEAPSIGRPIANIQTHILDRNLQPVPIGVPGDLYLAGVGLARGYLKRPELTAERFIPDPLGSAAGARLYSTGDRARFLPDGNIEFLGRRDQQVKIRGFRIEPGEIESILGQHPGVREAVVLAREDSKREIWLVAYVGLREEAWERGTTGAEEVLREFLKKKLPEYMVPAAFMLMKTLPLTANGKVDRRALPRPGDEPDLRKAFVAPRTPVEEMLAGIWAELLQVPRVGAQDNFFRLGGHSLMATQVLSRVRNSFGVDLGVEALFELGTVANLAERIDSMRRGGAQGNGAAVARRQLTSAARPSNADARAAATTPLEAWPGASQEEESDLSFAQERLWFLEQLQPGQAFNNIAAALRIKGELNQEALRKSFTEIVRRHQVFRTAFRSRQGRPVAAISHNRCSPEAGGNGFELSLIDLRQLPMEEREVEAQQLAEADARQPFDLAGGRLLRGTLLQLDAREHLLLITTHHIVSDGWSMGILYRELSALYEAFSQGRPSPLAELPIQYADFVRWQRECLQGDFLEKQLGFWKGQLNGRIEPLQLPTLRPRPPIQTFNGATHFFTIPAALHAALRKLSRREDVTPFMLLLAAFKALLHRYSGQEEIIVGSAVAGRLEAETERVAGLFLNTLALRTNLEGNPSFRELLKRVRKVALDAYTNQEAPFEKIVEALPVERDLSRPPLFQVMFVYQNAPAEAAKLAGLEVTPVPRDNGASKFDLTFYLEEHAGGLAGSLEYNTDLFDQETMIRLLGHYETLLEAVANDPAQLLSSLPILTGNERRQLLKDWNDTRVEYSAEKCVHQFFESQAARAPDAVAVVFEEEELTYRQLNERANGLARHLQSLGVGPEARVGLCVHRSIEMVVGLLGILKAGGCYVPLDPNYPRERIAFMLEDSHARVLVSEEKLAEGFSTPGIQVVALDTWRPATFSSQLPSNPISGVTPENLAYLIYTSGSTGKPKGVMVCHRNVANFFAGMDARLGTEPGVWLAVTSISFDISVLELFWTLARGYKVVIQGEEGAFRAVEKAARPAGRKMEFSLFYFASDAGGPGEEKYQLLIEGAKFADQNGLSAVWTPERHFHAFGGLYPNAALTSAAVAMITKRVQLRAGSLVLPLHDPIRVAEDWAVVDQLSKGRAALSFASGWHPRDFVIAPQNHARRKELMIEGIQTVRKLWRGEAIQRTDGAGEQTEIRIFPKPIQRELPFWLTSAGSVETFRLAGEIGANLLTHLSGQSLEQLAKKIEVYRTAWKQQGHAQKEGHVSLMLHAFVWDNLDFVWEKVRQPFHDYLRIYRDLSTTGQAAAPPAAIAAGSDLSKQISSLLDNAVDRYLGTSGLFGTPDMCLQMVDRLKALGVDDVACLVDFGVEPELVLKSLRYLAQVNERSQPRAKPRGAGGYSLPEQLARHGVTHLQCTPSLAGMLAQDAQGLKGLHSLRRLLLGGEALPTSLVQHLEMPGRILNMYGPTETTVWSATHQVTESEGAIPIGRPIANTEIYIVDPRLQPVPVGVAGELLIGGAGVVRGYFRRPELTAEKFIPHLFTDQPGARLYRTGDSARFLADGKVEFLGRLDFQVKLRGFRIELGEIELAICQHPHVREAVVALRDFPAGDKRLVAYLVLRTPSAAVTEEQTSSNKTGGSKELAEIRAFVKGKLPDYMVPSAYEVLPQLPLTPNGKVDRKALPAPSGAHRASRGQSDSPPQTDAEKTIAAIWQKCLNGGSAGLHDNFFDLGGHSLLVARVHAQLCEAFHAEFPLIKLFQYPTISSLAKFLKDGQPENVSFQKIRDRALRQKGSFGGQRQSREVVS